MAKRKTLEEEINDFTNDWGLKEMLSFIEDIYPLVELYNVDEEDDWVEREVGKENLLNVRIIRTVYLVSKIAERHAGKLCTINIRYKRLWERLDKFSNEVTSERSSMVER